MISLREIFFVPKVEAATSCKEISVNRWVQRECDKWTQGRPIVDQSGMHEGLGLELAKFVASERSYFDGDEINWPEIQLYSVLFEKFLVLSDYSSYYWTFQ